MPTLLATKYLSFTPLQTLLILCWMVAMAIGPLLAVVGLAWILVSVASGLGRFLAGRERTTTPARR